MANDIVCGACRHPNNPWRRHCGSCGSGLPGGCAGCGTVNSVEDKFCGGCGHALRLTAPRSMGSARPERAPSTHTSTVPIDISELLPDGPDRG